MLSNEDSLKTEAMVTKINNCCRLSELEGVLKTDCYSMRYNYSNSVVIEAVYKKAEKLEPGVKKVFERYIKLIDNSWSSTYVARCKKTYLKILELRQNNQLEKASLLEGVLNNRNETAACDLAEIVDKISMENKELLEKVETGKLSPRRLYRNKDFKETKVCRRCGKERGIENFEHQSNVCVVCKQNSYYGYNNKRRKFRDVLGREITSKSNIDYDMLDIIVNSLKEQDDDSNKAGVIDLDFAVNLSDQLVNQLEDLGHVSINDEEIDKIMKISENCEKVINSLNKFKTCNNKA